MNKPLSEWTLGEVQKYCKITQCGDCCIGLWCENINKGPSDWDFSEPPRWTEQDREDAKMIKRVFNGFQIGVARDNLARLRTIAKDGFPSEYINSDMFPSLNPGESAMLDEIIGGAE